LLYSNYPGLQGEKRTMSQQSRTQLVRLALIEGAVIAVGAGMLGLLVVVACFIDPQLFAAMLAPPAH